MADKVTYLFFGFAAEYVLHPLYQHMQEKGHLCVELDLYSAQNPMEILSSLKDKPVVFINSAHLFFDKENFKTSYQHEGVMFSALEIMDYLRPLKSIYIPHDLTDFFHDDELPWIDLFDKLLMPMANFPYRFPATDIVNAGWIKRNQPVASIAAEHAKSIGFAMSEFEYYRRQGTEKAYATWQPILNQTTSLKLPLWKESDHFEKYLSERQINIFPSAGNLSDFIDTHALILTNGLSSVNSEAAYAGRTVINMVDEERCSMAEVKNELSHLPNIQFMTIDECQNYLAELHSGKQAIPLSTTPLIKPFDFALAMEHIEVQL